MDNYEKVISMLEKQQKTLDMLLMAQQATNEYLDSIAKTQVKSGRHMASINRSVLDMDDRLEQLWKRDR